MSYSRFRALRRILKEFDALHDDNGATGNSSNRPAGGGTQDTSTSSGNSYWGNMARDRDAAGTTVSHGRPIFPVFLLPNFRIPFRRRATDSSLESCGNICSPETSPDSSPATSAAGSPPGENYSPPRPNDTLPRYKIERTNPDTLRCSTCSADLAFGHQIISKGFTGRHGRAYLVSPPLSESELSSSPTATSSATRDLVNIRVGKPENRQLVTGWHTVADITCLVCHSKLGWKYVDAKESSQKYKVGKFILETERVVSFRSWDDAEAPLTDSLPVRVKSKGRPKMSEGAYDESDEGEEDVEFDSDDEDECEDIFAGTWDRDAVAKRRSKRVSRKRISSERAS